MAILSLRVLHTRLSVAVGENHDRTQAIISQMIIWVANANDCPNVTYDRALTQAITQGLRPWNPAAQVLML